MAKSNTTTQNKIKQMRFTGEVVHQSLPSAEQPLTLPVSALSANELSDILHTVIEMSSDLISIKDKDHRWLIANSKMLEMFELNHQDYQHQNNQEIAASTQPVFKHIFEHAEKSEQLIWKTQKPYQSEEIMPLPNGEQKSLIFNKALCFDHEQQPHHLITVAQDNSEHQFVEEKLHQRSAILDALIACDWLLHSTESWHSVAIRVLQQCCLALRFSRACILQVVENPNMHSPKNTLMYEWSTPGFVPTGKHWQQVDFNDSNLARWQTILLSEQPVMCEMNTLPDSERSLLKTHDTQSLVVLPLFIDQHIWGHIIVERCFDTEKTSSQELGSLMAISRTLSVAIKREQDEKHLNLAKIAFDTASEGIMIVNTEGMIIGINKGFTDITGYQEADILGKTPLVFQLAQHSFWHALKKTGKWTGEVTNYRQSGEEYIEWLTVTAYKDVYGKVIKYVCVFADITEIKQSQQQLSALVNHDPLTGLPNRRLITEMFGQAIKNAFRNETEFAVLFVDLDRFKTINDSLGHHMGDQLLLMVTDRIQRCLRANDIVGRLGGDEFIVMLEDLEHRDQAATKATQILQILNEMFLIEGRELFISASIGIAMYPHDGKTVDEVIKAADLAMYQAKNNGKNQCLFYCNTLGKHADERFKLEHDLRRALEKNQFELFYQVQVDLKTGLMIGAEALVRWRHPELGMIPPLKFIPLAEETGLILPIGEWVLRQAAQQATIWAELNPDFKKIAVNVSAVQIMQSHFMDTVCGILLETDCAPCLIELEITESALMKHTEHVMNSFQQIRSLGISIAIDDFGTGYSSLSLLKRLPLNQIKIDRSFIKDLPEDEDDAAISSAIYAMASQLGFTVVAEGIETEDQEQFLKALGCQEAQGYLYSHPLPAEQFLKLLNFHNDKIKNQPNNSKATILKVHHA